jgi:hypothetical protein
VEALKGNIMKPAQKFIVGYVLTLLFAAFVFLIVQA